MASEELVNLSIEESIAVLTLDHPSNGNALSAQMTTAIRDRFVSLHREQSVRAIVLRANGKHFCTGVDLAGNSALAPEASDLGPVGRVYRSQEHLAEMILAIHECDKPVIAAIQGAAVGGGLAIALACDLRIAGTSARFGAVFQRLGLSNCDVGVSYFLPRIIGPTRASEVMLTGELFSSTDADRFGMLNALVDDSEVAETAMRLARQIARNSEYGVWMTKRGMWLGLDASSLRQAMETENRTQVLGSFVGNVEVGAAAFFTKTEPEWKPL